MINRRHLVRFVVIILVGLEDLPSTENQVLVRDTFGRTIGPVTKDAEEMILWLVQPRDVRLYE